MQRKFKRGEIYFTELPAATGSVQQGKRPILVIQNDVGNEFSPNIIVLSLTSRITKKQLPTHVRVGVEHGLRFESDIQCESIITLDKRLVSLDSYLLTLPESKMKEVDKALQVSLGIFAPQPEPVQEVDMTIIHDVRQMIKTKKVTMSSMVSVFNRLCKTFNIEEAPIV